MSNIRKSDRPLRVKCNTEAVVADEVGTFASLQVHSMTVGIANIFSMPKLEKKYRITYDSCEGYYIVHTKRDEVQFCKDEQGLRFIDLTGSNVNKVCARNTKGTPRMKFSKPRKQDVVRT